MLGHVGSSGSEAAANSIAPLIRMVNQFAPHGYDTPRWHLYAGKTTQKGLPSG